jgi:hypothetical protein
MDQPSKVPTAKVAAASVAGAVTVLLVWIASLSGLDVPPEAASAFTTLTAFLAGYLKKTPAA